MKTITIEDNMQFKNVHHSVNKYYVKAIIYVLRYALNEFRPDSKF